MLYIYNDKSGITQFSAKSIQSGVEEFYPFLL